eukprot:1459008-Pleurochrysis_carterae.AAC.1
MDIPVARYSSSLVTMRSTEHFLPTYLPPCVRCYFCTYWVLLPDAFPFCISCAPSPKLAHTLCTLRCGGVAARHAVAPAAHELEASP